MLIIFVNFIEGGIMIRVDFIINKMLEDIDLASVSFESKTKGKKKL